MAARGPLVALGALLLIGGAAVLGYGLTRPASGPSKQASEAMGGAIGQLDSDVKAARATVKERAETLAALQPARTAIDTDARTALDMLVRGELQFNPQSGEVIELGRTPIGGKPETLLIQPEGRAQSAHAGVVGSFADLVDGKLVITQVAPVTSKYKAAQLVGYVAVSRPLDLDPAIKNLIAAGVAGKLDIAGQTRTIGAAPVGGPDRSVTRGGAADPSAPAQTMSLPSLPDVKLVVAVPTQTGGTAMPLVAGGGAAAALALILIVVGLVTGRRAASTVAPTSPAFATAATQVSTPPLITGPGAAASGTPSLVDAGASYVTPSNLGPGAALGRWEIIKRLGSGGMADVYLARARGDAGFEKTVAVKVMHPHLARAQRAVEHFLDEARLAARIHHPNVCAIQDLGKIGNEYVIVMEFVDGVDLDRLLASARAAQRPVPIDVGLGILCRICDGLDAAHKAIAPDGTPLNIVHRDVKAANVLLSRQGGVKVVDFGIAKAALQSHNTIAGETKGTPSMMSPEQRVGEVVDVRADVYSVSAVGYEILTGQSVNLDLAALAHLGIDNWPHLPTPSSVRGQLPPELDALLMRGMSYDRTKRPADCAELEAMLEKIMKQHGLSASDKDIARWVSSELAVLPSASAEETAQTAGVT